MHRRSFINALALACAGTALSVRAQEGRPIRIVIGVPVGGVMDLLARTIAEQARAQLGRPLIVEARPGAAGRTAAEYVKNAAPDGSTLFFTAMAPMVAYPFSYARLRYEPFTDFVPVAHVANYAFAFAVAPNVPAKDLASYVALVKREPQYGNFSSAGAGTVPHFFGLMFAKAAGISMTHVPYRGTAAAITDLMGGQIPAFMGGLSDVQRLHKAGRVRILAVAGAHRADSMPSVPTLKEQGYDVDGTGWYAIYAPAGTPEAIVSSYATAFTQAARSPTAKAFAAESDLEVTGLGPAELIRVQRADYAKWGPVIKASGFNADD